MAALRIFLLCTLLTGCAPGYAGDAARVSTHVNGRYVAVGGFVVSH